MSIFAVVDCDNFFASCEKAFRPGLANRPVVVLSNNDGIVVARSPEAKKLGIPMGEAVFKIRTLIKAHKIAVFSSSYDFYADMSNRVMKIVSRWTPDFEPYSIDEIFLNLTHHRTPDLDSEARGKIKEVFQWTGLPISIGVADTKTLAKIAIEKAKKIPEHYYNILDESKRDALLKEIPVGDVWGVGRNLLKKFLKLGLKTAWDLSRVEPWWMRKNYSIIQERLVRELRGESCLECEEVSPGKKSIQHSRSFRDAVSDFGEMQEAISDFTVKAAEKLRLQNGAASGIYVQANTSGFRKDEEFYSQGAACRFRVPTDSTREMLRAALQCWERIYKPNRAFKRATVILMDIVDFDAVQAQNLLFEVDEDFPKVQRESDHDLMLAIDEINRKMGGGSVFFAAQGVERTPHWKTARETFAPLSRFTTSSEGMLVVYAR